MRDIPARRNQRAGRQTVIEVGVDVSNAAIMVTSTPTLWPGQLHQLRDASDGALPSRIAS